MNAFIVDHFALGGKKESKYDERILSSSSLQTVDMSLNP